MKRTLLIPAILILGVVSAAGQSSGPIAARKDMMKNVAKANGEVGKISKGEAPFKLETVQAALKVMVESSKTMPEYYPDNAKNGGETRALPKIWDAKADFNAQWAKFGKEAAEAAAKITDEATFKASYGAVLKNCDACHDVYRAPKT